MKSFRRLLLGLWLALWPFLLWALWTPISFGALRLAIVVAVVGLCFLPLAQSPRSRAARIAGAVFLLLGSTLALWPAKFRDPHELRSIYLQRLLAYRNTPYVWGGENARGLDCSGLMRRALVDANVEEGFRTRNPALWREAFALWWNDCSALEMKNGYGGKLRPRFPASNLNEIPNARLQPGDLAVTQNGVHVLAFVGGKTWVEADPNLAQGGDKVILVKSPSRNGWFQMPVQIMRWTQLDASQIRSHEAP